MSNAISAVFKIFRPLAVVLAVVLIIPVAAFAQDTASIVGLVRDTSGGVLPGVTIEASSPVLIEKTRSVVSDAAGLYRVERLRGGVYTVTFTLPGFKTIRREGIELAGSFAATVNADLQVGSVEESITVTGETPIVDVQSSKIQRVIDQALLTSIPTGRTPQVAAFLIPGVSINNVDVGGTNVINTTGGSLAVHGGSNADTRLLIDGVTIANTEGTGWSANMLPNMTSTQEVAVDYASASAESITGGLQINMIPKTGGNTFSGSLFATAVNDKFEGSNTNADLQARGLRTPNSLKHQSDINPGFGGPLRQNTLWFYTAGRFTRQANYVGGLFRNKNAFDNSQWLYVPDEGNRAVNNAREQSVNLRITWQMAQNHKLNFFYDQHWRCQCSVTTPTLSEEAANELEYPISDFRTVAWTATLTNRLLFEARGGLRREEYAYTPENKEDPQRLMIQVTDQGGLIPGLVYRGGGQSAGTSPYGRTLGVSIPSNATLTYVTGSHSAKFGVYNVTAQRTTWIDDSALKLKYRINTTVPQANGTFPNQLTQNATPIYRKERQRMDLGIFAQDKWTMNRLTLSGGVRFDHYSSYFPEQVLGPGPHVPNRNITLPHTEMLSWSDVVPRLGSVFDVFGDGKTAIKVSINKYVNAAGLQGTYGDTGNPVNRMANIVTRTWIDNGNWTPDCDLTNVLAQDKRSTGGDLCGVVSDTNFGKPIASLNYDPETLTGWGNRPFQWEFSSSVQRELARGVSLDIGYFRRWFGNFGVTDNLALSPSDFTAFSVTAPADTRLPNGGGNKIDGFLNVVPAKAATPQNNQFRLASNYGAWTQRWNGFDVSINARPGHGLTLNGGISTGKQVQDSCEVTAKVPENGVAGSLNSFLNTPYCHQEDPWLTDGKLTASYAVPKIGVQISALYFSRPGPNLQAQKVYTNLEVKPSLGRDLAQNAQNITLNLIAPNGVVGDRRNQLDLRFGKQFNVNRAKIGANFELYNAFNSNAVLTESNTYSNASISGWRIPQSILPPRFIKLSMQLDF
jgi:carboxypeptidase family protein